MRQFGIAAVLEFIDKGATAAMGRVGKTVTALRSSLRGVQDGAQQFGRGLGSVAMASAPVGMAFGLMVRDGMKFEQSMANLKAVTLDSSGTSTESLKQLAKTLGATTKFSASEAADAMTNLARAGFDVKEIMAAVPGTLNAAAAEGIDLATAADLVASNVRAFGLSAAEASEVAGTLALVSARTNTNMVGLQEGMKFAAPAAKILGWNVKETALALGVMSDLGVKNTLAGTALRQAIVRLTKPTKETLSVFGGRDGLNKVLMDTEGRTRPLADVMMDFAGIVAKQPNAVKRAEMASKIFGVRAQSLGSAFTFTTERLEAFRAKQAELRKESGQTAEKMRDIQIQTLGGQFVLLRSALESVNIELFGLISNFTGKGVITVTDALSNLSLALRVVRGEKIVDPTSVALLKKMPAVYLDIANGIKDGFTAAKQAISSVISALGTVGRALGLTGVEGARGISGLITKFTLLTVAIGPLSIVGFGVLKLFGGFANMAIGAGRVIYGLIPVIGSLGRMFVGLRWSILGPIGIVALLVAQFVDFKSIWEGVKQSLGETGALGVLWDSLKSLAGEFGNLLASMFGVQGSSEGWKAFGRMIGGVLSEIIKAVAKLAEYLQNVLQLIQAITSGDAWKAISQTFGGQGFHTAPVDEAAMKEATVRTSAEQLAGMAKRGVTELAGPEGGKTALTREYATGRVTDMLMKQGLNQQQVADALNRLSGVLGQIPTTAGAKPATPVEAKDALVTSSGFMGVSAGDVVLNRASLANAITSQMSGGMAGRVGAGAFPGGDPGHSTPAQASGGGSLRIEVPLTVDGRQLAMAVAEVKLDQLERGGRIKPGARAALLSGRLVPGEGY
jgi:TP901 family phage tail tape measure protein